MILAPTGPFCPFRSKAALEMDPRMQQAQILAPEIGLEFNKLQEEIQAGREPNPEQLRKVADAMEEAMDLWESLLTRLKLSSDFQTREYAKFNQALVASINQGIDTEQAAKLMRWQAQCMKAMADNSLPPMPPEGLDMNKIIEMAQDDSQQPPSIQNIMHQRITVDPFTGEEEVFESPTVREEYEALCRDHEQLIEMGSSYSNFDPSGKMAFLDEIEKVEERWQTFVYRFKLMGKLNKEFTRQVDEFLGSMGMDENKYNELLKRTHELMREDAEREAMMGL